MQGNTNYLAMENTQDNKKEYLNPSQFDRDKKIADEFENISEMVDNDYQVQQNNYSKNLKKNQNTNTTEDLVNVSVYVIPLISILIILSKKFKRSITLWHARQSIIFQLIFFTILFILRLIQIPIISFQFVTVLSLLGLCVMIFSGIKAYNKEKFMIPVIYDIARNYIDKED